MRPELPSGVTFLFSDIEGSTKLLHERGAVRGALAERRRVIRAACSSAQPIGLWRKAK